jgi:hypothetical protein
LAATQAYGRPGPDRLVVDRWISRPSRSTRPRETSKPHAGLARSTRALLVSSVCRRPYLVGAGRRRVHRLCPPSPIKVTSLSRAVSTSDSLPAAAPALARTQRIFLNLTDRQSVAAVVCWLRTCSPAHGSCRGCPACEPPPSGTHSSFCAPLPLFGCLVG